MQVNVARLSDNAFKVSRIADEGLYFRNEPQPEADSQQDLRCQKDEVKQRKKNSISEGLQNVFAAVVCRVTSLTLTYLQSIFNNFSAYKICGFQENEITKKRNSWGSRGGNDYKNFVDPFLG